MASASATLPAREHPHPAPSTSAAARAIAMRAFADGRTRTIAFAALFALYSYVQPAGYRHAYPTLAQRVAFAHSFASNDALRLFYGYPYDVQAVGGYTAWRVGGTLAIAAAVFGVLAAVRALRAEEDTGRAEIVLSGCLGRGAYFAAALAAIAAATALLWAAELVGFLAGGLPAGPSAYLALATASVVAVFTGIGALASQLAPSRRVALEIGTAALALLLLLRVVADTASGAGWLRWLTPLGWAEELRPFAGAQPLVLLLPVAATIASLALAARLSAHRDIGAGLLPVRDRRRPRTGLLSSPEALAVRLEGASLAVWLAGVGAFAIVLGLVSASVSSAGISASLSRELAKVGASSIATPTGYLSFAFIFFVLAVSLFACSRVSAARHEEAEQRLETLLSLPVGRMRWLAGRLALAVAGVLVLSLAAGALAWAGAAAAGVSVSFASMLGAGANCAPVALLALGVAALAYALVPRASVGVAYGLVAVAFLWDLVGPLLGAPRWVVDLTPFEHVGLVPAHPFAAVAAAAMVAGGAACALLALWAFRRRDLVGG